MCYLRPVLKVHLLACAAALLGAACDTSLGSGPDGGAGMPDAPASCVAAEGYSDLASIEENIFKRQCSFGPCHDNSGPPAEKLILLPGLSHAELVNVASIQQPTIKLVDPGNPATSYLMIKLGDYDQSLRKKTLMPQGTTKGLCIEKRDAIRRWIEAGAPSGLPDAAPPPPDGGSPDAARPDAARPDARPAPDARRPDAATPDAAP